MDNGGARWATAGRARGAATSRPPHPFERPEAETSEPSAGRRDLQREQGDAHRDGDRVAEATEEAEAKAEEDKHADHGWLM